MAECTIVLKRALPNGSGSLELREPRAAELETAAAAGVWSARTRALLAYIVGGKPEDYGEMAASDLARANEYFERFNVAPDLGGVELLRLDFAVPLKHGNDTIAVLELAEPKAIDLDEAAGTVNYVTASLMLGSAVTKIPRSVLGQMAASDLARMAAFFGFFLRPGQLTSAGPSPTSPIGSAGDPTMPGA